MIATPHTFPASQRLTLSAYLLSLLAILAYAQLSDSPTPLIAGIAAAVIAWLVIDSPAIKTPLLPLLQRNAAPRSPFYRWLFGEPSPYRTTPRIIINAAVLMAALYLWFDVQDNDKPLYLALSLDNFVFLLLLCKFFEHKGRRDLIQILTLATILVVATTMYSQSLAYGILLLGYFLVLVYVLVLFNLQTSFGFAQDAPQTVIVPVLASPGFPLLAAPPRSRWRRWFTRAPVPMTPARAFADDLRRLAIRAAFCLVPIALVIFLILPRSNRSNSFFSTWTGPGGGVTYQTGFSEVVQFRDYGQLAESDAVVMEVRLLNPDGTNIGSEFLDPYFRGLTLDRYDAVNRRWTRSLDADPAPTQIPLDSGYAQFLPQERLEETKLITQEYTLRLPPSEHVLFAISPVARIVANQFGAVSFTPATQALSYDGPTPRVVRYTAQSLPVQDPSVFPVTLPPSQPVPGEITRLARNLVQDLLPTTDAALSPDVARQIVNRFETYLRTNYPYTLTFSQVDLNLDYTADFLLNRKETGGHCEEFASAIVMMCRSVGIPARIVSGYRGGEFNSLSGYFTVRQKNAHTWAEYYIQDVGWLQSDPTPGDLHVDDPNAILKRWAREFSQIIQNAWLATVVSFDNDSRRTVVAWLTSCFASIKQSLSESWNAVLLALSGSSDVWMRLSLLGPAIGLLAIFSWMFRLWRRGRLRLELPTQRRRVRLSGDAQFLDELLRLVERRTAALGQPRSPQQTPREFIDSAAPHLGSAAEDARWLVDTFYALQFGAVPASPTLRHQISSALRHLREWIRQAQPQLPVK